MPFPNLRHKIKNFWDDRSGSEAVEFVGTLMMALLLVVSLVSILAYAYRVNELNYANRRAVRAIEVTGIYDQASTEALVQNLLPHMEDVTVTVRNQSGATLTGSNNKIQLRDTFSVTLESHYVFEVFSNTTLNYFQIPIASSVQGMSEVYWK